VTTFYPRSLSLTAPYDVASNIRQTLTPALLNQNVENGGFVPESSRVIHRWYLEGAQDAASLGTSGPALPPPRRRVNFAFTSGLPPPREGSSTELRNSGGVKLSLPRMEPAFSKGLSST
jgi:hypothetical protein